MLVNERLLDTVVMLALATAVAGPMLTRRALLQLRQ